MGPAEPAGSLAIEVVVGLAPRQIQRVQLVLPSGCTVAQALDAAHVWGMTDTLSLNAIESGEWTVGVWGRNERLGHVLHDQDRIEVVRCLNVDPKEARRVRYRSHSEKWPKDNKRGPNKPKA